MFLVAITKSEIAHNFQSVDVEEFKINSFVVTVVTDNFLSKCISEANGFSVTESPLISSPNSRNIVFSQANYDKNDNVFNIFRSTISGRPIYYHINSKGDFFCSTHISMLRKAGVPIEENTEVLPEFFIYRYVMPPRTLYKDINHLFTGGRLQIRILDRKCIIQTIDHYNAPEKDQNISSIRNSSEKTYNFLSKSIERLNSCKDEIAVLLSGGIDSSILCNICQDRLGIDTSYSTGFPFEDPNLNIEKSYALSAAKALGMNHHYYEATTQDYLQGFLEAISLAEEPLHHLQSVLLHLLFKKGIPKNKKIIIQGQGAGFSFGNFRGYLYWKDKKIIKLLSKKPLKEILTRISRISRNGKGFINILNESTLKYPLSNPNNPIWSWHDFGSKNWVCNHFNVTEENIIEGRYNFVKKFDNRSVYDIWSLYSLLGDEDSTQPIWTKIGEGNKRIVYSPFYDLDVLNYVFSIPWTLKLRRPENKLRKEIARRNNIPEFIIKRPKSAFGIHSKRWSVKGGILEPLVPLASKVFDEKQIRDMQFSDPKRAMTFWNILNYSIWKRLCINNESVNVLLEELNETMKITPN